MLIIKGRRYYDFTMEIDILFKSTGLGGVAFRIKDTFNFYAFYINKTKGFKAIVKVEKGKEIILAQVNDGGILINNWHHITIQCNASKIRVTIYDAEQHNKTNSEKVMEVNNPSFSSGGVGLFINNMEGFFFDNLIVYPVRCWTAWVPRKDLDIVINLANVYLENFKEPLEEKYMIIDPTETNESSQWEQFPLYIFGRQSGIEQKSLIYDKSLYKKPSMILVKNKYLTNGIFKVTFIPYTKGGVISIVFKYLLEKTKIGATQESFYTFDLVNDYRNPQFLLRKINNGLVSEIKSLNKKNSGLNLLGYNVNIKHTVHIETIGQTIKIKISVGGSNMIEIFNVKENSIKTGLVGFGTFKAKCLFTEVNLIPPKLRISEADKLSVLSNESEDIFFPTLPQLENRHISIKDSIKDVKLSVIDKFKNNIKKGEEVQPLGWKICLSTTTTQNRKNYCEINFLLEAKKNQCKVI
jgi:hypothetical protein